MDIAYDIVCKGCNKSVMDEPVEFCGSCKGFVCRACEAKHGTPNHPWNPLTTLEGSDALRGTSSLPHCPDEYPTPSDS